MALPTKSEVYSRLMEHLRLAQEDAATLGHLTIDESPMTAQGWRAVSEMFRNTQVQVTKLATKGRLN
jgi:hypothetical protein